MTKLLAGALRLYESGFSIIPIKTDGSKEPSLLTWKPYQERQPTEAEMRMWFGNGQRLGIAIIGGAVSGNLEILDHDAPELIAEWRALVEETAPGLLDYVITAGSPATCHPSGKTYKLINGDLKSIPTITPTERDILLSCARSFNQYVKPAQHVARERQKKTPGLKPGEDFNRRGDVRALLENHGWRRLKSSSQGELWARPGADHTSATLFGDGSLYVFSTNAHPFEHERSYSPFAIFATLNHAGDYPAAAKALAAQGYGESDKPKEAKEEKKAKQPVKARIGNITFTVVEEGDRPGVYATDEDGNRDFICSRLYIEADTRDEHNENWGRLPRFPDRDGVWHTWAMPMSLLSGDGREYRERLLELGLEIDSKRKARTLLETYLNTNPNKKALCVTKQGWHRGAFVLPDETIGENGEPIYLQTLSTNHLFRQAGTLDEWRERVGQYCAGNSRLVLAASVAFAAPLLEPLQGENGGWHFTGTSSLGKTTTLYVAGSICGGGGDKGFIQRWRSTVGVWPSAQGTGG